MRFIIAVGRTGTLTAAAEQLHTTAARVGRRIDAAEAALDCKLFTRGANGYSLTGDGLDILRRLEPIEDAIVAAGLGEKRQDTARLVRIAAPATILTQVVAPAAGDIRQVLPDVRLSLVSGADFLDMRRGEVDISVRLGRIGDGVYDARRIGMIRYGVFRAACLPAPDAFVAFEDGFEDTPVSRFVAVRAIRPTIQVNRLGAMVALARGGVARAMLPSFIGEADETLAREGDYHEDFAQEAWLLLNPRSALRPSVAKAADIIARRMQSLIAAP